MDTHRPRNLKAGLWFCGVLLVAVVFFNVAPAHAQTTTTCPPPGSKKGDGDDLKCRAEMALDKNQALLSTLQNQVQNCVGPRCELLQGHFSRAQSALQRGKKANGRTKREDYEELNNVRKPKCTGKPSDCSAGTGGVSGGETDPTIGEDFADQLDDVVTGLDKANQVLSESQSSFLTLSSAASVTTAVPLYDFTQDPDYPTWLHLGQPNAQAIVGAKLALLTVSQVASMIKELGDAACKQTLVAAGFGGNSSLACIPFAFLKELTLTVFQIMSFIDADTSGWETHGAYVRAANINDNLGLIQGSIGDSQAQIDALKTQVDALKTQVTALQAAATALNHKLTAGKAIQEQIIQLMLVPDGRRVVNPLVLTCTGNNDCPKVLDCPGTQCSFSPR